MTITQQQTRPTPPTFPALAEREQRAFWPDALAYQEALQHPDSALPDSRLRGARVALGLHALPIVATGRFAAVFRLALPDNSRWALRCFTSPQSACSNISRAGHYAALTERLTPAVMGRVPFRFLPEGVRVNGRTFPALLMRWTDGEPLGHFIERYLHDADKLLNLAESLATLRESWEAASMVHGDWQHDNILVTDNGQTVTLVDYDGIWTPDIADDPPAETGHPNYQHPRRGSRPGAVAGADRFSHCALHAALLALAANPALWTLSAADGESVLWTRRDFAAWNQSAVAQAAYQSRGHLPPIRRALDALAAACHADAPSAICALSAQAARAEIAEIRHLLGTSTLARAAPSAFGYLHALDTGATRQAEQKSLQRARRIAVAGLLAVLWSLILRHDGQFACLLLLPALTWFFLEYLLWPPKRLADALEVEWNRRQLRRDQLRETLAQPIDRFHHLHLRQDLRRHENRLRELKQERQQFPYPNLSCFLRRLLRTNN